MDTLDARSRLLLAAIEQHRAGDSSAILRMLREPETLRDCRHEYPFVHRVEDVVVGKQLYELGRCCKCNERLFLVRADNVSDREPGVPLKFTGRVLRLWLARELRQPSKGPTDWEALFRYLSTHSDEEIARDEEVHKRGLKKAARLLKKSRVSAKRRRE